MSQATEMLAAYTAAELAVLKGKTVRFGDQELTLADLADIRKGRAEWQRAVNRESASGLHVGPALADFGGCT